MTESWTWGSASILQGCIEWMTGGACPCVNTGGAHFIDSFCEIKIIYDCLSSGFLYLFAWRATKYQRKDTRFQSFKSILALNQLFYCRAKRKGVPSGKIPRKFIIIMQNLVGSQNLYTLSMEKNHWLWSVTCFLSYLL